MRDVTPEQISIAQKQLQAERRIGDPLRIELAEDALNDLLDRYGKQLSHLSHVTTESK